MAVRTSFLVLLSWIGLLAAVPAAGQQAPDTTVTLEAVTVTADRETADPLAHVMVLGPEAVAATGADHVADLLEARSGAFITRYGSGGLATASLRGMGSQHTLILLDGQHVADPQSGQIDLSLLPTVLLESVAVLHGTASARYGSGAIGGVVSLRTLSPSEQPRLRLASGYGAFGERQLGGVITARGGVLSGLLAAEVSRSEGDFPYTDESQLEPSEQHREGADRTMTTLFGRLHCCGDQPGTRLMAWYNQAERGLPGTSNAPPSDARQWDRHLRLWLQHRISFEGGSLHTSARAQTTATRYRNTVAEEDTTRTQALALKATLRHLVGERWLLTEGLSAGLDRGTLRSGVQQAHLGAFWSAHGTYARWQIAPALRLDTYHTAGRSLARLNPQLGIDVQPLAWDGLHLKGRVGRAFRAPTLNERFWLPGGNPALAPEHGWSAEAGVHVQMERSAHRLEAEATYFTTDLRDQIVWAPSYVGPGLQVWRPSNLARVSTRGLEASLQGHARLAATSLHGGLFYTYTDARNRANPEAPAYGHPLRYVPREQLKLHLGLAWHAFRLDLSSRLVSRRFLTSDASQHLVPYQVLDARLRYATTVGGVTVTLAAGLENVLDEDYAIVHHYPMPPRHARMRLTAETPL